MPYRPGRYAILAMLMLGIAALPMLLAGERGHGGAGPGPATPAQSPGTAQAGLEEDLDGEWVAGQQIEYDGLEIQPFMVRARKAELEAYPCEDCHGDEPANPRERKLEEEHEELVLDHGRGRFWCLTCHGEKNKDALVSLKGKMINFDQSHLLCGQCHFQRQKDWVFGGHGKRLSGWRFARKIAMCVGCHDPHSPAIKPFKPAPPPLVRKGLKRRAFQHEFHVPAWDMANRRGERR